MVSYIVSRTNMLQSAIINVALKELGNGMLLFMLVESEFALPDQSFDVSGPTVSFLLPIEVIADRRIAFDEDYCSPLAGKRGVKKIIIPKTLQECFREGKKNPL